MTSLSASRRTFLSIAGVGTVAGVTATASDAAPARTAAALTVPTFGSDVLVVEDVTPVGGTTDTYRWKTAIDIARTAGTYTRIVGTKAEYTFTGPLIIDGLSNIEIAGLGPDKTLFRGDSGSSTNSLKALFTTKEVAGSGTAAPVSNVQFADFSVDGGMLALAPTDVGKRIRERPFPPDLSKTLLSAIRIRGNYGPNGSGQSVASITVKNVSVYGTRELPSF